MNPGPENSPATWSVPQCPFAIEYVPRVLDEIRLGVIDAFFSLPRGGAEIGGVLLGRHANQRVSVLGFRPLECEHAFGPSFTLSERDRARLQELLATALANPRAEFAPLEPVGWYHSHTRSEIFLSEVDREIHDLYFPKPWQVALVLKPHTFQPARAGFFFREADGSIHCEQSYGEFSLQSLPLPVPVPDSAASPPIPAAASEVPAAAHVRPISLPKPPEEPPGPVIVPKPLASPPVTPLAPPPPAADPASDAAPHPPPVEDAAPPLEDGAPITQESLPRFLTIEPPRLKRRWSRRLLLAGSLAAAAACGYFTRGLWLADAVTAFEAALPSGRPPALKLHVLDANGQLQIQWDTNSAALRNMKDAHLAITDGAPTRVIPLDAARLASGSFTYARQSGRVEVTLAVVQNYGDSVRERTTYLGQPPLGEPPGGSDEQLTRQRDDLLKENQQLKTDLQKERARSQKADQQLQYLKTQRENELRQKRVEKQTPDK